MPGATPKTQLPTMLDTDPMAQVAKAIRDLANALDGRVPKVGTAALTFDASGNATLTHGLGYLPVYVGVMGSVGSLVFGASGFTTTVAIINARLSTTGGLFTGGQSVRWIAL